MNMQIINRIEKDHNVLYLQHSCLNFNGLRTTLQRKTFAGPFIQNINNKLK